jgi:hypothetical protein
LALVSWRWFLGAGFLALVSWRWFPGAGFLGAGFLGLV